MRLSYLTVLAISTLIVNANVVEITEGMPYVEVEADGKTYKIQRVQEAGTYLTNTFALTSRPSPHFLLNLLKSLMASKPMGNWKH